MDVVKIANNVAAEVIRQKHYSRRKGMTEHSFALVANDAPDAIVLGVVTYGQAPLQVKKHVLGGERRTLC